MTNLPSTSTLPPIVLPQEVNYIGAFLTFACTLRCTYCINHHGGDLVKGRRMTGADWIRGLNRIVSRKDLPITLQGGEPTVHRDFYRIVAGVKDELSLDLLTNLEVDPVVFTKYISPKRLTRPSKYASIRVSYHQGQSKRQELLERVSTLTKLGYHIGIWIVDHPDNRKHTDDTVRLAQDLGIDIRLKEFLGPHNGQVYGTFRYPDSVDSTHLRYCQCSTTELLIGPSGAIFRCHSDLYANREPVGHILDCKFTGTDITATRPCSVYGKCNSCDVKVKYDRFQQHGHSSVTIQSIGKPYTTNPNYVQEVVNTYGKR